MAIKGSGFGAKPGPKSSDRDKKTIAIAKSTVTVSTSFSFLIHSNRIERVIAFQAFVSRRSSLSLKLLSLSR